MAQNNINNINVAKDLIQEVKSGKSTVETFSQKLTPGQIDGNVIVSLIEAHALQNQSLFNKNSYLESFNKARRAVTGDTRNIELLNEEEKEALKAEAQNLEKFNTQTANDTGDGLTLLASLVETNLTPVLDDYFYNSPIMRLAMTDQGTENVEVRDVTNDRQGQSLGETTTPTPTADTIVIDTISPKKIRFIDEKEISWLLSELGDPVYAGELIGRRQRAIAYQMETQFLGDPTLNTDQATGTASATYGYAVLNNKAASGDNRGSILIEDPDGTSGDLGGLGIANNLDAVNYLLGQLPLSSESEISQQDTAVNYTTYIKLTRTLDGDGKRLGFDQLLNGKTPVIMQTLPDDLILVGKFSHIRIKTLSAPKFTTYINNSNNVNLVYDTYGDSTVRFAYKATPTKNGFRHGFLPSDGDFS